MQITKRAQYALRAMIVLAEKKKVCPLREVAKEEAIPFDYLEKIFSKLEKENLVVSKRGPLGGYVLSRLPDKITLKNIFDAVGEPVLAIDCLKMGCPRDKSCRASRAWREVNTKVEEALSSIKLSDLSNPL